MVLPGALNFLAECDELLKKLAISTLMIVLLTAVLYLSLSEKALPETGMLVGPDGVSDSDVLLDVSDGAESHIPGAVHINYADLCGEDEVLKPSDELARIFGELGISEKDSVVIYGECRPCGGSGVTIHPSTLTYFALLSLGHHNVKLLDGGIRAWQEAGRKVSREIPKKRPATIYTPHPTEALQASIEQIEGNEFQLVDARTIKEFEASTIPGSINIPADTVISNGWFKADPELRSIFEAKGLNKDRPVVVFTSTGVKASVVWFALKRMGYDSRLFAMRMWVEAGKPLVKPKPTPAPGSAISP